MSKQQIVIPCMQCQSEAMKNGEIPQPIFYRCFVEPRKAISFTCLHGHKNRVAVQSFPFDLLLSWAFEDFIEGDYAAAMTNFASSLERFLELSYKILQKGNGLTVEQINQFWDSLSKSSERQFGAFLGLYVTTIHDLPFSVNQYAKNAKYRNDAVHGGERNPRQVKTYGQFVIDIIHKIIENLLSHNLENAKNEIILDQLNKMGGCTATMCHDFVSWEYSSDAVNDIERKLGELSRKDGLSYAKMAMEANETDKCLSVNEK